MSIQISGSLRSAEGSNPKQAMQITMQQIAIDSAAQFLRSIDVCQTDFSRVFFASESNACNKMIMA